MILKAYKYRLLPTPEQAKYIDRVIGCARFVYNAALETKINAWESAKASLSAYDLSKQLTEMKKDPEFQFLNEVHAIPLIAAIRNMDSAYQNFFKRKIGYPRFRSRDGVQSFQFHQGYKIDGNRIKIPKLDTPIKFIRHRDFEGDPKTCTISRTPSGKYYFSIQVHIEGEYPAPVQVTSADAVGIDVNVGSYNLSTGKAYDTPRALKAGQDRLKFLQRQLSRKKKGSANWHKQKLKIAKHHEKISAIRRDWLHNLTHELTEEYGTLCIEDLNVAGMKRRPKAKEREGGGYEQNGAKRKAGLNRSISDAAFGEFRRQLQYKAQWKGKNVLLADRFAPTSKKCHVCEHIQELSLHERVWTCDNCGTEHDRDLNAAKNIKKIALEKSGYEGGQTPGLPVEGINCDPCEAGSLQLSEKQGIQ